MTTFAVGDVVQLKAGGAKMTVVYVNHHDLTLRTVWFDASTSLQNGEFKWAIVEISPPEPKFLEG